MLDPGRGTTKTGYLWALARDDRPWGGEDPPGMVSFSAPGRAGENAETFLTGVDALVAGHDEGGVSWGRIASLIGTCKITGVEPVAYLEATLTAIATGHPENDIDDLLPWNLKSSS